MKTTEFSLPSSPQIYQNQREDKNRDCLQFRVIGKCGKNRSPTVVDNYREKNPEKAMMARGRHTSADMFQSNTQ